MTAMIGMSKHTIMKDKVGNKLFLMSMGISNEAFIAFENLVGKKPAEIKIVMIENAADIVPGSENWLPAFRDPWIKRNYLINRLDLREWIDPPREKELFQFMSMYDAIWIGGGHTYYLRWIQKASCADRIIQKLVAEGKTYAGWSAGAVVAGPTIKHFDKMGDDANDSPEQIFTGLGLMPGIVVPHIDHPDFAIGAQATSTALRADGYQTIAMKDGDFLVFDAQG
jgi:dipeptidase E